MFDKARQVGCAAVSKDFIEGDCGGLRRRSGACSLAALGNGLKLQRSSAAKARSCSDARQGKLSQGRPRPMPHSLQRRATASVEAFKAPKHATQQFRKPMEAVCRAYVTARAGFGACSRTTASTVEIKAVFARLTPPLGFVLAVLAEDGLGLGWGAFESCSGRL